MESDEKVTHPSWCCPYCGLDVGYLGNWLSKLFGTQIHDCREVQKLNNQTVEQKRVLAVLKRMVEQVESDEGYAEIYVDMLEDGLSELRGNDAFGTEGQCDPRGDMREQEWSMNDFIEGVDL